MSSLEQFSANKAKNESSKAIFGVIKDMFSLGVKEFSKSISHIFQTPTGAKHQITTDLALRERKLIRSRRHG